MWFRCGAAEPKSERADSVLKHRPALTTAKRGKQMAIADTASIISGWPVEGVGLNEALQRMPGFEAQAAAIRHWVERGRYNRRATFDLMQHCYSALLDLLASGALILTGYRSDKLERAIAIDAPMTQHLQIESDKDTVRLPDGSMIYTPRIYRAGTWRPKPIPVEVVEQYDEPAHYRHIRAMADLAFPQGWRHLRQAMVLRGVADQFQKDREPVPERQMLLRALGYRKR